jgi:hypothetical protein
VPAFPPLAGSRRLSQSGGTGLGAFRASPAFAGRAAVRCGTPARIEAMARQTRGVIGAEFYPHERHEGELLTKAART